MIVRRARWRLLACIVLALCFNLDLAFAAGPQPKPRFLLPHKTPFRTSLNGFVIVSVAQRNARVAESDIAIVTFEYSADHGQSWTLISRYPDNPVRMVKRSRDPNPELWEALWDVRGLASTRYTLRATMETIDGQRGVRRRGVRVDQLPIPVITCNGTGNPGEVEFHGEQSSDPDGRVKRWDWTFGDGAIPGTCSPASGNTCFDPSDCSVGEVCANRACSASAGFCNADGACPTGETCLPGMCTGATCFDDSECAASQTCAGGVPRKTAEGSVVTHVFADINQEYTVSLIVTDNRHRFDTGKVVVLWLNALSPVCAAPPAAATECKCNSIKVGKTGAALGPKGDGKEKWDPEKDVDDGKTMGPLSKNPGNKKKRLGFAFEVVAEIEGDAKKCTQIQWAKGTGVAAKKWIGTVKDLDLDGTNDIDVSTNAKCVAAGGAWDAGTSKCTLSFPLAGKKYGPDEYAQGEVGGAYQTTDYPYKKHPDDKIIWWDTPASPNPTFDADFVAVIKGSDNKYCFAQFNMRADKNALPEKLTVDAEKKDVGKADLPKHQW